MNNEAAMIKPMFRVLVSRADRTYTLIQEGTTLTEEQAEQIYWAYKENNGKKVNDDGIDG